MKWRQKEGKKKSREGKEGQQKGNKYEGAAK